jgi:hypothetical protein
MPTRALPVLWQARTHRLSREAEVRRFVFLSGLAVQSDFDLFHFYLHLFEIKKIAKFALFM